MTRNDSYVIRKEQCPKCRELGNDRSHDNLAVYSDGHCYCFRCGYSTGRKHITQTIEKPATSIVLPADVTTTLPTEARQWLEQYQLSRLDLQQNHVMWSDKWSRLIFPYFDDTGLIAWQGRYVPCGMNKVEINGKIPAKWFSQGKIHEIIHPIKVRNRTAILVEDIISAIKVSQFAGSIPIFGSSISAKQFLRLKTLVDRVYLWLDPDMRTKSVSMASLGKLMGLETHVIFSDKDPKDHDHASIANIYGEAKAKTESDVNPLLPILST